MGAERQAGVAVEMDLENVGVCSHNRGEFIRDGHGPTCFGTVGLDGKHGHDFVVKSFCRDDPNPKKEAYR
jgi:hypothetical protein